MDLIWTKREGIYFCDKDWTASISLIGLEKFAVRRKGGRLISAPLAPSFRGDAKHRTTTCGRTSGNLEIP
jgi:hypothetical protein